MKEKTIVYTSLFIVALVMIYLAFTADGTGDWGDAIYHYLYSRYAFAHPENFLNHWAKPVYVLITAPIAQGGFTAVKLFNVAMLLSSMWITWQVGKKLALPNAWFVIFPMIAAPMNTYQILSGLTEPLFACWLIFGIYCLVSEKYILGALWLSFLPFVRSEGLVVLCVVPFYLLVKYKWYLIPLLAVGHIFYGAVGYFYYKDFFWIFNKMSYATLDGAYGAGKLWHYANEMHTVIGDFQPVLLVIGLLAGLMQLIRYWRGKGQFSKERIWLIYGIAIAYFIAHSIFWYCGIFNSFGLLRVMIGVIPLFSLIILEGVNLILSLFPIKWRKYSNLFLAALVVTLFFYLHDKLIYKFHFFQNAAQRGQNELVERHKANYKDYTYYFDAVHIALPLEADWFDPLVHRTTPQLFTGEPIPTKSLIIWDNIFTLGETNLPLDKFLQDNRLKLVDCIETGTWENPKPKSCLFEFDSTFANASILLQTGFEEATDDLSMLDSVNVKTGRYSRVLNETHAYSSSFSGWLNSFQQKNAYIRISCWVYLPNNQQLHPTSTQMVLSFESKEKPFAYHSQPLFDENDQLGSWKYVTFEQAIPTPKLFSDKIKAYIWNSNSQSVLIDDLVIDWYVKE